MNKTILLLASFFYWFSLYLYIPYLTPYLLSLGLTATLAGVIFSLHSFAQMALRFPIGMKSDSIGKQKIFIILGLAFSTVSAGIMFMFPNNITIALGNLLSGFASAMYVAFTVLYARYYADNETNKAMGIIGTAVDFGIFIAFLIGGFLYEKYGVRSVFFGSMVIGFIGLISSLFVKEVPRKPKKLEKKEVLETIKNKELIFSSVLCILVKGITFATAFSFTPKIAEDLGATGAETGIASALFIGASVLGSYFISTKLGDKLGNYRTTLIGFVILGLYSFSVPFVQNIPALMFVEFVGGLGYASLTAIFMANAVRHLPLELKATGMGIYQAAYSIGSTLGPILLGVLADSFSYKVGFITIAVVAIIGFFLTITAKKQNCMD